MLKKTYYFSNSCVKKCRLDFSKWPLFQFKSINLGTDTDSTVSSPNREKSGRVGIKNKSRRKFTQVSGIFSPLTDFSLSSPFIFVSFGESIRPSLLLIFLVNFLQNKQLNKRNTQTFYCYLGFKFRWMFYWAQCFAFQFCIAAKIKFFRYSLSWMWNKTMSNFCVPLETSVPLTVFNDPKERF